MPPAIRSGENDVRNEENTGDTKLWRDLTAFWILGLCNYFGYVVMLSMAADLLPLLVQDDPAYYDDTCVERNCHLLAVDAIFLANILPTFLVILISPYLPFWVNLRVLVIIALAVIGFLMVAIAKTAWMLVLGIIIASTSCGLGESTFLAYTVRFDRGVVATWSSGTGAAGFFGILTYISLSLMQMRPVVMMLFALYFPTLTAVAFWLLLRSPNPDMQVEKLQNAFMMDTTAQLWYIIGLQIYLLPLMLVFTCVYFINIGLFSIIYFSNYIINAEVQYKCYIVIYQLGVFVSRSSVRIFTMKAIIILLLLEGFNVIYFVTEAIYCYTPYIWMTFIVVLWEGLISGFAYLNTFYRMSKVIPVDRRQFAMEIVALADSFGMIVASLIAIPVHNGICLMPAVE